MIHVIGIGAEGKASLGARALDAIGKATLIAGGRRHLEEFRDCGAEKVTIRGGLDEVERAIKKHISSRKGAAVAVLATGDPLLFGIGGFIVKKFGKPRVEVIPNVSTVQEAFARIKTEWGAVKVLSAHGRAASIEKITEEAARSEKLAIFTDPDNTPADIARALIEKGVVRHSAYVCESLGTADERTTEYALGTLARRKSFAPLNVLLLVRDTAAAGADKGTDSPLFGLPDSAFVHSSGMITKEEVRAVTLSKLALRYNGVLWDIGAGCGSVSVEAARLSAGGSVIAIEKEAKRISQIEKNRKKFRLGNLTVVRGVAPACLEGLESPDAVFIGGGGAGLSGIMRYASKKIKKGGRMVVNAVTLETAQGAIEHLRRGGWKWEVVMINIARSRGLGGLNMLAAHNPVFVISGTRP